MDEDVDGKIDNDEEERPKKTKEAPAHYWEDFNSEHTLWTISKDKITKEEYQGFYISLTK